MWISFIDKLNLKTQKEWERFGAEFTRTDMLFEFDFRIRSK